MGQLFRHFWLASLVLMSVPAFSHNDPWENLVKRIFKNNKYITLTAGLEIKPSYRLSPKIVNFKGVIEVPSQLYLSSGHGRVHATAGQIILDNHVTCEYSPRTHNSKNFYLVGCSDRSRANEQVRVNGKVELRLNHCASDSSKLVAKVRVIKSEQVQYGLTLPYIEAEEGQVLMFDGDAWVAVDPSELDLPLGSSGQPGPQGEVGPIGPMGPMGPAGLQGPKGDSGVAGAKGEKGDPGVAGAKGEKGDPGVAGKDGAPGLLGPKGDDGMPGIQGPMGPQGPAGIKGDKGDKGDKGEAGMSKVAYLRDERPSGVNGGTCSINTWHTRVLNTLGGDDSFITMSSNRFQLQPGTYFIEVRAPSYAASIHQAKLKVIETNVDVLYGSNEFSHPSSGSVTASVISGEVIVAAVSTFEVQHRCAQDRLNFGFGVATGWGSPEIYTQVKIIKKQ